jgi:hypothetical protein
MQRNKLANVLSEGQVPDENVFIADWSVASQ